MHCDTEQGIFFCYFYLLLISFWLTQRKIRSVMKIRNMESPAWESFIQYPINREERILTKTT